MTNIAATYKVRFADLKNFSRVRKFAGSAKVAKVTKKRKIELMYDERSGDCMTAANISF